MKPDGEEKDGASDATAANADAAGRKSSSRENECYSCIKCGYRMVWWMSAKCAKHPFRTPDAAGNVLGTG